MPTDFYNQVVAHEDVTAEKNLQVQQHAYFDTEVDNGNSGAAKTIDWTTGNKQKVTLTADCTFTFTAPAGACNLVLRLIQDGSGNRTPTFPATCRWPDGGTLPAWSTAGGAIDLLEIYYNGTNYYCVEALDFQAAV